MSAPEGIDWSWAVSTGGALSSRQRRQLLTPLLRTVVSYSVCRTRLALGRRGTDGVDIDRLRWPDSALARAAEEEIRDTLSADIVAHSYRTYLFALSLAALDGASVDEELCYVACLLHDLNLAVPTPGRCFAVVGGERAEQFALARGESAQRSAAIGAAIAAHITVGASEDLSDPGGFVSAGAFVDVSGTRIDELAPGWVEGLLTRYPRHDFKRRLTTYFSDEAKAVPAGRARWLNRTAGFPILVRMAPFPE
ncbi:MAG TPA: HD domain-containing protein [Pseudonocardia sp.]|jgi:hypothetical protein|nr:HD domain-containing protein [Pseudonocardia sp.]